MEFTSQYELYKKILPVFKVKTRLINYSKNKNITNEDIWLYLIENKWKNSHNLTLAEIVNDIINIEVENINKK